MNVERCTMAGMTNKLFRRILCRQPRFILGRFKQREFSCAGIQADSRHPISRYPLVEDEDVQKMPDDIKERMEDVKEKSGFLPNVFKVLAHRPDEFRSFFMYYDALMEETTRLSKAEKEMIVVATSAINNCNYCLASHGALLRIYSKNPLLGDQVAINHQHADISDRQKTMLDFAVVVAEGKPITDAQMNHMRESGFDDEIIWDIGSIASFFALSNRMAHLTNMRPNDEFYLLGRIPKETK